MVGVSAPKLSTVVHVVTDGASPSLGIGLVELVLVWDKELGGGERISLVKCQYEIIWRGFVISAHLVKEVIDEERLSAGITARAINSTSKLLVRNI